MYIAQYFIGSYTPVYGVLFVKGIILLLSSKNAIQRRIGVREVYKMDLRIILIKHIQGNNRLKEMLFTLIERGKTNTEIASIIKGELLEMIDSSLIGDYRRLYREALQACLSTVDFMEIINIITG